jgi:hypothetical protein
MSKRLSIFMFSLALQLPAFAACFKEDPVAPPSRQLKTVIDYEPDGMMNLGESPVGTSNSTYPPTLTDDQVRQLENRAMRHGESGKVLYFEPALNGGWRVCRIDLWLPTLDFAPNQAMLERTKQYASENELLWKLVKQDRYLAYSTIYAFDTKGRIERIEQADFSERPKTTFKAQHCRRYDQNDNVVSWVRPKNTHECPATEPSLRDEWRQFKYAMYKGKQIQLLSRWHIPKGESEWKEEWSPILLAPTPDAVGGNANVDSRKGVWEIFGSTYGKLDNNAANLVVDDSGHWRGSNYYFPKQAVPMSVLENPEELYKYERRRVTNLGSRTRMVELFKPNEHISRHRFYMTEDYVVRHEQLDQKGRVTRIITLNDWRQPRPGPNPDFNDKLLDIAVSRFTSRKIYHRVYDVAANGQPSLVALSWDKSARLLFKGRPSSEKQLEFGTPDGKVRWRTADEFYKAFDSSSDARQVFPDIDDVNVSANLHPTTM